MIDAKNNRKRLRLRLNLNIIFTQGVSRKLFPYR